MANLDSVFGMSAQALSLRAQRTELLSANIANSDTPGYKARDIDFAAAMRNASGEQDAMLRTHAQHFSAAGTVNASGTAVEPMYRVPGQPSLDGNTVESQREHAAFMDNAIRYQASLTFLSGTINSLRTAIRGQV